MVGNRKKLIRMQLLFYTDLSCINVQNDEKRKDTQSQDWILKDRGIYVR